MKKLIPLLATLALAGCTKLPTADLTGNPNEGNHAPKVTAMKDSVASVKDTITITATASDTDGNLSEILWWSFDFGKTWAHSSGLNGLKWAFAAVGKDTLLVRSTDSPGLFSVPDTVVFTVNLDAPTAKAGDDKTVEVDSSFTLDGDALAVGKFTISELAWNVGENGTFLPFDKGLYSGKGASKAENQKPYILRATDNRGIQSFDTLYVTTIPVVLKWDSERT